MRKIAIICYLLTVTTVHAQGIRFEQTSLDSAQVNAKMEKKLIFVDCYTPWCPPCKWMEKNVFTNDTVGAFYNEHFINVQLNMDDTISGKAFAKKYQVWFYPTYLFIDGDGNVVHRFTKKRTVADFINLSKDALDPASQFGTLYSKYASKTITPDECVRYLIMRKESYLSTDAELSYYLDTQTEKDFFNDRNWNMLQVFTLPSSSLLFQYVLKYRLEYDTKYGADSVGKMISKVYMKEMTACFPQKGGPDTSAYSNLRSIIEALHIPESEKIILIGDIRLFYTTGNWDGYAQTVTTYVSRYVSNNNFSVLNDFAWYFYLYVDDQHYLDIATAWVEQSMQMKIGYFNRDTYAGLLYKRGKYEEALLQVDKAIELAQQEGVPNYDETRALKKNIEMALQKKEN